MLRHTPHCGHLSPAANVSSLNGMTLVPLSYFLALQHALIYTNLSQCLLALDISKGCTIIRPIEISNKIGLEHLDVINTVITIIGINSSVQYLNSFFRRIIYVCIKLYIPETRR